jgi:hypothetical protein
MNTHPIAALMGGSPANSGSQGFDGVVEIGLLLPAKRAAALMTLAKDRQESVGQVLRTLIERELSDASPSRG